jgi:hypothetical protein
MVAYAQANLVPPGFSFASQYVHWSTLQPTHVEARADDPSLVSRTQAGYLCAEWIDLPFGSTPCLSGLTNHKRVCQTESWGSRYPFLGQRVALRVSVAPFVPMD